MIYVLAVQRNIQIYICVCIYVILSKIGRICLKVFFLFIKFYRCSDYIYHQRSHKDSSNHLDS